MFQPVPHFKAMIFKLLLALGFFYALLPLVATAADKVIDVTKAELELPGGGTPEAAKIQLPEKEAAYPEFNTFGKVMPAYGIYARHVRGVKFQNVRTTLVKPDARPATVFIDAQDVTPADFAGGSSKPR